jgi:hypothetical protein
VDLPCLVRNPASCPFNILFSEPRNEIRKCHTTPLTNIRASVNANRQHYELAAAALAQADPGWLADLITRRVPLAAWEDAYRRSPDDIKTVLSFPDTT